MRRNLVDVEISRREYQFADLCEGVVVVGVVGVFLEIADDDVFDTVLVYYRLYLLCVARQVDDVDVVMSRRDVVVEYVVLRV